MSKYRVEYDNAMNAETYPEVISKRIAQNRVNELEAERTELLEALKESNLDVYILADRYPNDYNNKRAMNRYLKNNDIITKCEEY